MAKKRSEARGKVARSRMTAVDIRDIFETSLVLTGRILERLKNPTEKGDAETYVNCAASHAGNYLGLAGVLWRCGLGDPRPALTEAYNLAEQCASLWIRHRSEPHENCTFAFGKADLVGRLIAPTKSSLLKAVRPDVSRWKSDIQFILTYPDAGLLDSIENEEVPSGYTDMLADCFRTRRDHDLFADTYDNYIALLRAVWQSDRPTIVNLVQRADRLYADRATDEEYEEFSQIAGGGKSNPYCIDFPLAVIVQHCLQLYPDLDRHLTTPHRWTFDPPAKASESQT